METREDDFDRCLEFMAPQRVLREQQILLKSSLELFKIVKRLEMKNILNMKN